MLREPIPQRLKELHRLGWDILWLAQVRRKREPLPDLPHQRAGRQQTRHGRRVVMRRWEKGAEGEVLEDEGVGDGFVEGGEVAGGIGVDDGLEGEIGGKVVADHVVREVIEHSAE
jgi:hypothetical protein